MGGGGGGTPIGIRYTAGILAKSCQTLNFKILDLTSMTFNSVLLQTVSSEIFSERKLQIKLLKKVAKNAVLEKLSIRYAGKKEVIRTIIVKAGGLRFPNGHFNLLL